MRSFPPVGGGATLFLVLLAMAVAAPRKAQAQCSVLDRHPCTPYFCGIHGGPRCIPELEFPLNQVPVLKVNGHAGTSEPIDREHKANRLDELGPLLSKCLEMPPDDAARPGMRVTLKLAFKRNGELLAPPRFTYTTHEASPEQKQIYREAALDMLKRCTPLPVTESLGGAIAGRPFVIPIIETRTGRKAEAPPNPTDTTDGRHP
jgi:hypothetical protein